MSVYLEPERPLEPPEPKIPRCSNCGAVAKEWWPWTEKYYCELCAIDATRDYLAEKSDAELLEMVGMEPVGW